MKSTRREFLGFLGFAVGTSALFTACGKVPSIANPSDEPISRPPGALEEEEFLARCMRCKQCIYACMNNTKQEESPSSNVLFAMPLSRGLTLVNTPLRDESKARCSGCGRCGQVCPSGAIDSAGAVAQVLADVCVGCFKCVTAAVCPVTPEPAITMDSTTGYPKINYDTCTGCGACVVACTEEGLSEPKPAIVVVSPAEVIPLPDKNIHQRGAQVLANACVGCFKCTVEGVCPVTPTPAIAMDMTSGYPKVNIGACIGCGACADACTATGFADTKPAIELKVKSEITPLPVTNPNRKVAWVMPSCHACNNKPCFRACTYGAIENLPMGQKAVINYDKCVGCGDCAAKCTYRPNDLIMIPRSELAARQAAEAASAAPTTPVTPTP